MLEFIGSSDGSTFMLFGVNLFEYKWKDCKERIEVTDPIYGQKHLFNKYCINIVDKEYYFVSGEFSNNIYGFYIEL